MPNQWDLTGVNIEDSYQRVLQTPDGINIYDGTGSLFTGSFTGSFYGTASWAYNSLTASYALASSDILVYVKNQSGQNIAKGVVVRITGSNNSSNIPRVVTASYENDNNSANTLGITYQSIANGSEGYVVTEGILTGINTNDFISGQLIYLGPTGSIIGYAPIAPLHAVRLGEVIRHQSNNGSIYVRIDNGYELDELHNVRINTASLSSGDLLIYSSSVWTNAKQLTGSYGLTGSLNITGNTVIDVSSSSEAFRVTQRGTGLALKIEDENNPDSTPFVVNASGNVGIGTDSPAYRLDVTGSSDGNVIARIGNILVGDWDPAGGYTGFASMRHKDVAKDNYAFIQGSDGVTYFGGSTAQYFGLGGTSILKLELGGGAGTGSLIPDNSRVADLGSPTNLFRNLYLKNNAVISGSTTSILGFTGSLQGTASWADSASQALTASFLPVNTYNITSSWAQSASQALTASYVTGSIYNSTNLALSASYALTASYALNADSGGGGGTNLGLVYAVSLGYLMP